MPVGLLVCEWWGIKKGDAVWVGEGHTKKVKLLMSISVFNKYQADFFSLGL